MGPPALFIEEEMALMAVAAKASGSRRKGFSESLYAYGYITPALVAMVFASFVPICFTIFVAFTNWDQSHNALVEGFHFVGLRNFRTILSDLRGELLGVLIWTVAFAAIATTINFFVGLFLAFLLNNPNMPERNFYRTILILPWAVPGTIMTTAWSGLLNVNFGPVNTLLNQLHISAIPWLTDPNWARFTVIMVNLWFGYPFMMTANLGALQSIPTDLMEAALVDGAGIFTRFWRITFPLLRSATLPLVISTFAFNLNNFGAVYVLTGGGPFSLGKVSGATDILPTYTYKLAINLSLFGLASAYAVVIFFFVAGFSLINMKYSRAFEAVD
jgi:arabinogalactan oligomer/maltooligosaccharide transport system permease protein